MMVELAVDIVAFCIVAAAVVAVLAIVGAIWLNFGHWLDAIPGRRKRFWTLLGTALAILGLLAWHSLSPATLIAATALAVLVGAGVGICLVLDRLGWRWKVAAVWITWAALLLGLLGIVLHLRGWRP